MPLALPVILAGVRTGAVYAIGIVTIGALVGAGGLGDYIVTGLSRGDDGLILLGVIPILVLTLLVVLGPGRHRLAVAEAQHAGAGAGRRPDRPVRCRLRRRRAPSCSRGGPDLRIGSKNFTEAKSWPKSSSRCSRPTPT